VSLQLVDASVLIASVKCVKVNTRILAASHNTYARVFCTIWTKRAFDWQIRILVFDGETLDKFKRVRVSTKAFKEDNCVTGTVCKEQIFLILAEGGQRGDGTASNNNYFVDEHQSRIFHLKTKSRYETFEVTNP